MKKKKILHFIEERIPKVLIRSIKSRIKKRYIYDCVYYTSKKKMIEKKMSTADAVFFTPGRFLSDEIISKAKNAKIFQLWSSGFEKFNFQAAKKHRIILSNNGGENSTSVSEHTLLLMLGVLRKVISFNKIAISGNWKGNSHGTDLFELKNKCIGIIGFGNIGRKVAKLCNAFDAKVFYYDTKKISKNLEKKLNVKYLNKTNLLKKADIITLHLHLNEKTKNFLSDKEFKYMKKNVFLVNVSRAQLINYKSLLKNLKNRKIAGLAMDVFYQEPNNPKDPIFKFKDILFTPHTAGSTWDTYMRVIDNCLKNIDQALTNKKILWQVN